MPRPTFAKAISGFDVYGGGRAQNVSIVGGKVSSSVTFRYTFVPRSIGQLTIPPVAITYEGKTYRTAPITITSTKAPAQASPGARAPGGRAPSGRAPAVAKPEPQIFVTSKVDKKQAYVGEQITYTFRLYLRVQLLSRANFTRPAFSGFLSEDLQPREFQLPRHNVGYRVSEVRYALFPTAPGRYTISPAALQVNVASTANPDPFMSFFQTGRMQTLRTKAISVNILPLPAKGRPGNFTGAVGSYRLTASLDRKIVDAGRPVTLTVELKGQGLVKTLKEPEWPEMPSLRRYETVSSLNVSNSGDAIQGDKTFKVILIPGSSGLVTIPAITYPIFDPRRKRYVTLKSPPLKLTVKPGPAQTPAATGLASQARGPEGIKTVQQDIRFIKSEYGTARARPHAPDTYWKIQAIPVVFFLAGAFVAWRRRRRLADPAGRRARYALAGARDRLKQAERHARHGRKLEFHVALHEAISGFLADKWNVSPSGLTLTEIEHRLAAAGLPEPGRKLLRALWEEADLIRYAPAATSSTDLRKHLGEARNLLQDLEKTLANPGRRTALLMLLAIAATATSAAANPDSKFASANAAYESGRYAKALERYRDLLEDGSTTSAALAYNLANTHYRLRARGRAIMWYERARRLSPRDADIRYNLKLARSALQDEDASIWESADVFLTLAQLRMATAIAIWLLCGAAGIALGYDRAPPRAVVAVRIFIPLLLIFGAWWSLRANHAAKPWAVITLPAVEVRSGPGDQYAVGFTAPEGRRTLILNRRPGWIEIGIPSQSLKGWVTEESVEKI